MTKYSVLLVAVGILAGCGESMPTTPPPTTAAVSTAASLQMSAIPTTVKSNNSDSTTIIISAVSAGNAAVPNETIFVSADTGLLAAQTVTTDSTGTATVTFSAGNSSKDNRLAIITATVGAITSSVPVQIIGSTLTVNSSTSALIANGALPATLTVTANDAGGAPISGTTVTLTQSGAGAVTFTPASGTTDANGNLAVSVAGAAAGTVTVNVGAVGTTASTNFTVAASVATTFAINQLTLTPAGTVTVPISPKTSAMQIGDALAVKVNAPAPTANVVFATTVGTWTGACAEGNGGSTCTIPALAGVATASLGSNVAGVASVEVRDLNNTMLSDSLTVGITAKTPAYILLQADQNVVTRSVGDTVGLSNLTARVFDAVGAPVGNALVAFSIVEGTGTNSGETLSPVMALTTATPGGTDLGTARTTFTSGSLSAVQPGVQIRASVVGTTIATQPIALQNTSSSSLDTAIMVGGTAASVTFGQAARIIDAGQSSPIYSYSMAVLVADASGNPAPMGTVVSLSAWPIAWTTGSRRAGCDPDIDGRVWSPSLGMYVIGNAGTFYNEDANENLILDPGEDGYRKYFNSNAFVGMGTTDNQFTPPSAAGGVIVSTNAADPVGTASTDASGLATFYLTYTKTNAFFVTTRIRAQTLVQGTPVVGQIFVPLGPSEADFNLLTGECFLSPAPYFY